MITKRGGMRRRLIMLGSAGVARSPATTRIAV